MKFQVLRSFSVIGSDKNRVSKFVIRVRQVFTVFLMITSINCDLYQIFLTCPIVFLGLLLSTGF